MLYNDILGTVHLIKKIMESCPSKEEELKVDLRVGDFVRHKETGRGYKVALIDHVNQGRVYVEDRNMGSNMGIWFPTSKVKVTVPKLKVGDYVRYNNKEQKLYRVVTVPTAQSPWGSGGAGEGYLFIADANSSKKMMFHTHVSFLERVNNEVSEEDDPILRISRIFNNIIAKKASMEDMDDEAVYELSKEGENKMLPTKVKFNDKKRATTLFFGDKVTYVKATKGDKYDRTFGFLMAFFQHHSGMSRNKANKYLEDLVKEDK